MSDTVLNKTYCLLEQGQSVNDPTTTMKKVQFTTDFSDFYRLNWKHEEDPNAFIFQDDIVWSEGRSLLYCHVPKNYDYYIFIDDDVELSCPSGEDVPSKIKNLLEVYRPLTGTFLDIERFCDPELHDFLGGIELQKCRMRAAFPVAGYDQQVQIFSSEYAAVMFPVPYHGAGASMWYSQWVCFQQFPYKQACFTEVQAQNTRCEPHANHKREHFLRFFNQCALFDKDLLKGEYARSLVTIAKENQSIFDCLVDTNKIDYSLEILGDIYDTTNPFFANRMPTVKSNEGYQARLARYIPEVDRDRIIEEHLQARDADRQRKIMRTHDDQSAR